MDPQASHLFLVKLNFFEGFSNRLVLFALALTTYSGFSSSWLQANAPPLLTQHELTLQNGNSNTNFSTSKLNVNSTATFFSNAGLWQVCHHQLQLPTSSSTLSNTTNSTTTSSTFCCSPIFSDNAHHCLALIIRMSSQLHNHPLLLQRTTTIASSLHHHRLDPNAFASLLVIYVNAAFCLGASTLLHYSILISSALLLKGDHHQWPERKGKRIARSKKLVAFRIAKLLTLLMGTVLHWGTGRRFTDLLTTTLVETNADDLKVQLASVNVTTISWHFGAGCHFNRLATTLLVIASLCSTFDLLLSLVVEPMLQKRMMMSIADNSRQKREKMGQKNAKQCFELAEKRKAKVKRNQSHNLAMCNDAPNCLENTSANNSSKLVTDNTGKR